MTQPTRLSQYGPEYRILLARAVAAPPETPFTMLLESPQKAAALRRRIYGFFAALRNDPRSAKDTAEADSLQVTLDGSRIVFLRRQDSWESQAIFAALNETPTKPPQAQHLEALHKVREKKASQKSEK